MGVGVLAFMGSGLEPGGGKGFLADGMLLALEAWGADKVMAGSKAAVGRNAMPGSHAWISRQPLRTHARRGGWRLGVSGGCAAGQLCGGG